MKTLVTLFFLFIAFKSLISQASVLGHNASAIGDWLGWDGGIVMPLNIEHRDDQDIYLRTGSGAIQGPVRMSIMGTGSTNPGYIGIGTNFTSPSQLLTISGGNISIQSFNFAYHLGGSHFIRANGDPSNVHLGHLSGNNSIPDPSHNTFLGNKAGRSLFGFYNTMNPPFSIGFWNVFIGSEAGEFYDPANSPPGKEGGHVFIGYKAGQNYTKGTNPKTYGNVFIGAEAGVNANFGGENTFIGGYAGVGATGNANTFVGFFSGNTNTTGQNNTYIGTATLGNVTGMENILVGSGSGQGPSHIDNSVAIGSGATVMNSHHFILGNNRHSVGIGYDADAVGPQNKLDINALPGMPFNSSIVGGTSGLRFHQLRASSTMAINPGLGYLTVDGNGNVVYASLPPSALNCGDNGLSMQGPTAGCIHLGQNLGSGPTGPGQLLNNREIPLNNHWILFSDPAASGFSAGANALRIGTNSSPVAKFDVVRSFYPGGTVAQPVGAYVHNSDESSLSFGARSIGVQVITDGNLGTSGENFGGHFFAIGACQNTGVFGFADNFSSCAGLHHAIGGDFVGQNTTFNVGVRGFADSPTMSGVTNYGGYFEAVNAPVNYGVYAIGPFNLSPPYPGIGAAGMFNGDLFYTGNLSFVSDLRLKSNIKPIVDADSLLRVLKPVSYTFKSKENIHLPSSLQFGLISQEVLEIFPNLVVPMTIPEKRDSSGEIIFEQEEYLGINYTGLIPLLLSAYQKQSQELDSLKSLMSQCLKAQQYGGSPAEKDSLSKATVRLASGKPVIVLSPNVPNPFKDQTTIHLNLPENIQNARVVFRDLNGKVIEELELKERGKVELTVYGEDLSAGTYLYSLFVDGKHFETRKMTKSQ